MNDSKNQQQIGELTGLVRTNSELIKEISSDMKELTKLVGTVTGELGGHEKWLKSLNDMLHEERKKTQDIKEEMSYFKGGVKLAVALWTTVSSIIVGTILHYTTKQ
jgi:chromosome segregation ATPase